MGSITLTLVQCLVFSALIVAVDPVAVSTHNNNGIFEPAI